jgi:ATP-dependent helicase/nuclease subunit A
MEWVDEEAVIRFPAPQGRARGRATSGTLTAAERGTLHHRFLEHLELERVDTPEGLAAQARALVQRGMFSEAEAAALDLTAVATFWNSAVGQRIRARSASVRRELPFTVRFQDTEVRSHLGQAPDAALEGEFVVVQGVIDLAVVLADEVWLLDFKTDDVTGEALESRVKEYAPQLQLYAGALQRVFRRPVTVRWLHFLTAGQTVELGAAHPAQGAG